MLQNGKRKAVLVEAVDRISDLPESILHHTLSFLPTYDSVHTCVLSRRWRYVWMGIHTLEFYENGSKIDFINFAHNVLLLHDSTAAIKKVIFNLSGYDDLEPDDLEPDIQTLVIKILGLKLQELDLSIVCDIVYPLYSSVWLTVLKLGDYFTCSIPSSMCFPSLKIMHFFSIEFIAEEGIQQISISCPILEEFIIRNCDFNSFDAMHIYVPILRLLKIDDERQTTHPNSPKVKIYAESLVSFEVGTGLLFDLSLCIGLSLNSASIYIYEDDYAYVTNLMQGIQKVKELTLSSSTVSIFSPLKNLLALPNLTKLTLSCIQSLEVEVFTEFLCSLPQIQSLVITSVFFYCLSVVCDKLAKIPESFISQLKSFEIRWFYGKKCEVSLVEFLLKNGRAMEKIIIVLDSGLTKDVKKQNEFMGRMLNLPRDSTSCLIVFSQKH